MMFESVNSKGEENEPFAIIGGRLYGTASDAPWGNTHDSGVRGGLLMRRILNATAFGPVFWAGATLPPGPDTNHTYPLCKFIRCNPLGIHRF